MDNETRCGGATGRIRNLANNAAEEPVSELVGEGSRND